MEAKDTVMSDKDLMVTRVNSSQFVNNELLKNYIISSQAEVAIASRQAEISFNAGIKEVIDWINEHNTEWNGNPRVHKITIGSVGWCNKLKEWGIKNE
jgi:hypothetical protein